MKYIQLFENFKVGEGDLDLLDLHLMNQQEVEDLFFLELSEYYVNLDNIKMILDSGIVDIDTKSYNYSGVSALHIATLDSVELTEFFLDRGANPNSTDQFGRSPLYFAVDNDLYNQVELLLKRGANPNIKTKYLVTPLHKAAYRGNIDMIELLIENGAEINERDDMDRTPLLMNTDPKIKELLISYGGTE